MFYLKYRPQKISEIDNIKIQEQLIHLLEKKDIPHALLFTGPKGAGKTSSARLVAKAINCAHTIFNDPKSNTIEPCNTCEMCIAITKSSAIDVIEIDAASNRKIDEIRELINTIKFAPIYAQFKVYIIDEVHMLTQEAFNALLKTLEEPPKNTIFILATTDVDKMPKTIVSRCIRFNFGQASDNEIISMLKRIRGSEHIKVEDDVLLLLATHCDHSFRDGAKLLEEITAQNALTLNLARAYLGLTEHENQFIQLCGEKKLNETLRFLEEYAHQGGSFKTLIEQSLSTLHIELLAITLENKKGLFTPKDLSKLIKLLQEAYTGLKSSPIEALPLEIAIIEYISEGK